MTVTFKKGIHSNQEKYSRWRKGEKGMIDACSVHSEEVARRILRQGEEVVYVLC